MTRKKALLIIGTWMACALGRWTHAENPDKKDKLLNLDDFARGAFTPSTIIFNLHQYKKIIIHYSDETLDIDPKEIFEALNNHPRKSSVKVGDAAE